MVFGPPPPPFRRAAWAGLRFYGGSYLRPLGPAHCTPPVKGSGLSPGCAALDSGVSHGSAQAGGREASAMISAKLTNTTRRAVYRRDGYRCALCDSTKYLQVHHYIKRSQGGHNGLHNLICLCADCHALAHGTILNERGITQEDVQQAVMEYLADYYAQDWNPWEAGP